MQSADTLATRRMSLDSAIGIRFQAVAAGVSGNDRFRREAVDAKLGGVNRFRTVADVIDHFLGETERLSSLRSNPRFRSTVSFATSRTPYPIALEVVSEGLPRSLLSSSADSSDNGPSPLPGYDSSFRCVHRE